MLGPGFPVLPDSCSSLPGITGILMSAAGLPVCLTRPPKLVLHPPPVSKSEIKSIPGVSNTSRKTTKKQARKGISLLIFWGDWQPRPWLPALALPLLLRVTPMAYPLCALTSASAKQAKLLPVLMIIPH